MTDRTITGKIVAGAVATVAGIGALSMAATAQTGGGQSYDGDHVRVENFIGRVEIRTGGSDIRVEIRNPGDVAEDPVASGSRDGVTIDGGQSVRNLNCRTRDNEIRIGRRFASHSIDEYPTLVITAPDTITFELDDSAFVGQAGDLGALNLSMNSCGRFEAGAISREADIRINGSGDVDVSSIGGDAEIRINGSGDVVTGTIGGRVQVSINGSGDVETDDVAGDADVDINGSGDVEFARVAGLDVDISGSGDVVAGSMNGAFSAGIAGSGDIAVRRGQAQPFEASINGSGDISFGGTATDVRIREGGGGDVEIAEIEGSIDWRRNGRTVLRSGGSK